jgi:hypothetical protein
MRRGTLNVCTLTVGISTKDEELDLPLLYWVPKLHNYPYTQRYIAGSAICPKDWCDSDVDTEEI